MRVALEEHCHSIVALALALAPPLTYHCPGELACAYAHLVHAVPPFHAAPRWEAQLAACWRRAYAVADASGFRVLAAPLLGAGARGAPTEAAAAVAARAAVTWRRHRSGGGGGGGGGAGAQLQTVRFAVQEVEAAAALGAALEDAVRGSAGAFAEANITETAITRNGVKVPNNTPFASARRGREARCRAPPRSPLGA